MKISMTLVNCLTSKPPVWCNILLRLLYVFISRIVANFVLNSRIFITMAAGVL